MKMSNTRNRLSVTTSENSLEGRVMLSASAVDDSSTIAATSASFGIEGTSEEATSIGIGSAGPGGQASSFSKITKIPRKGAKPTDVVASASSNKGGQALGEARALQGSTAETTSAGTDAAVSAGPTGFAFADASARSAFRPAGGRPLFADAMSSTFTG